MVLSSVCSVVRYFASSTKVQLELFGPTKSLVVWFPAFAGMTVGGAFNPVLLLQWRDELIELVRATGICWYLLAELPVGYSAA